MTSHMGSWMKLLTRGALPTARAVPVEDAELLVEYEKFFQAVAASPSSVVITDSDGKIEYVNDRFVESTGYARDVAIGRKPNILKSGTTPSEVYDELWATITAGKIWRGELCNRRRNGEHYWEATAIAPIFGDGSKPTHFVAVKEDITERRLAEDRLKSSQQRDRLLATATEALLRDVSDEALEYVLSLLGTELGTARAFVHCVDGGFDGGFDGGGPDGGEAIGDDDASISQVYEWTSTGMRSHRDDFLGLPCKAFSWCLERYRQGHVMDIADVGDLPETAGRFKAALLQGGVSASLTAPVLSGGRFKGIIGVDVEGGPRHWKAGEIELLERFANIYALALLRRDAEDNMRRAHERAQHAEQNLRDAIECLPEGFVLYDAEGKLITCNTRFRADYGYNPTEARPGVHFTDLGRIDVSRGNVSVPEGYKDSESYLQSRLAYRTQLQGTFPVQLRDGRHLMTRDRRTPSGGLVSIQTDITRIKKTEEALRISERKFWSVFHASPSLMAIAGLEDGRFLDVNAKWSETMGYDYTDIIGRTAQELNIWTSPNARTRMVAAFNKNGILTDYEGQLRTRSGEVREFLMSGSIITIDDVEHLLLVSHDITERKKMERALKRSELEVRNILDSIVEAFYRTDADGHLIMASAAIEPLLGYTPEEVVGMAVQDLYVDPDEREPFLDAVRKGGGFVRDYEVRLRRKDGAVIWAATNARYLYDRDENIIGLEGTTRDITLQKRAEAALLLAKEDAERANAAKSEFLSGMSHELRTPLNAVIGFAQMMELHSTSDLSRQEHEYLGIIRTSGEHLLSLINEILDLAKVEAGRMEVRAAPVDTRALIEEAITLVQPLAKARSIALENKLPETVAHVYVDRTKFKQILINLLSNAVKYNVDGGRAWVEVGQSNDALLDIRVFDTGPGLTPEQCGALFEPFQRLGAERSEVEGTGLGLVLAKRMIEAMGGTIRVESTPGTGSCFELSVPVHVL